MPARIVGEAIEGDQSRLLLRADSLEGGERIMTTQLPQAIVGLAVDAQPVPGSNAEPKTHNAINKDSANRTPASETEQDSEDSDSE